MNKLFRPIAMGLMGLALVACDKTEDFAPLDKPTTATVEEAVPNENPPILFNLSANLGGVDLLGLPTADDGINEDELRADINFNGTTSAPKLTTMSLLYTYFGERMDGLAVKTYPTAPIHKLNARWGVIYGDSNKAYGTNCTISDNQTPASDPTDNLVVLKNGAEGVSINEAQVQMYCQLPANLENEEKKFAFMCLDGVEGKTETTKTRQYFNGSFTDDDGQTYVCDTDPNARIEGLTKDTRIQKDRHIPIMSDVVAYEKLATKTDTKQEKLAPRGSFIGLCIKNELGEDITITHIVVSPLETCLDFAGYFDWERNSEGKARFLAQIPTSQKTVGEYAFPVYKGDEAGYLIPQNSTQNPCFYVWGFQNGYKVGKPFQVQIRFKNSADEVFTTKVFKIAAPNSKLREGKKMFDDGFAYHSLLPITTANYDANSGASDWNGNGGFLPNNGGTTNTNGATSSYDGMSVSLGFKTPLDFVAEAPAINKAGDAFVTNHNIPNTTVIADYNDTEVGYYNWEEAVALFDGSKPFLANYYLPSKEQLQSIVPYLVRPSYSNPTNFYGVLSKRTLVETAQVGEFAPESYESDFITIKENDRHVTYALRFKGTDWVSSWRYSYEIRAGKGYVVIKCVPLRDKSNVTLDNIKKDDFFITNACSIRTFPSYGYRVRNIAPIASDTGRSSWYWSSSKFDAPAGTEDKNLSADLGYKDVYIRVHDYHNRSNGLVVRPFVKKP